MNSETGNNKNVEDLRASANANTNASALLYKMAKRHTTFQIDKKVRKKWFSIHTCKQACECARALECQWKTHQKK